MDGLQRSDLLFGSETRFLICPTETLPVKPTAVILDLGSALFVDDSLPNVDAALSLGIQAFHFKRSPACYQALRELLF